MSQPTSLNDLERQMRPTRPRSAQVIRWVITVAIIGPAIWSALGLNISVGRILSAPADMWKIVRLMLFWPELTPEYVGQRVFPFVLESLYIAWIGTMIGAFFSFLLSFPAAKNLSPVWLSSIIRQIFNAIRAFPELLVAFIFLPIFGLGPWTGTLAIGIHSIGTLGKLSSEAIEGIDPGPLEAIRAAGGGWSSVMRFGVLPQVLPTIVAYWLYRFEINLRVSAFLGVIGAGGVGAEMLNQIRFRSFPKVGAVLITVIVVVLIIDTISAALRRRIIMGKVEEVAAPEVFMEPETAEIM
jgi:phosphonate transport system permease protein